MHLDTEILGYTTAASFEYVFRILLILGLEPHMVLFYI